ncbi:phosphoribosylformylglycinamidine synthase I [Candidatus Woesearchaeota archaeon]|nr:phosphoribosylformylglycinamidine synthase I [Candidatus Woesearchaeota archaeon]
MVKAIVFQTDGTNCDRETAFAFRLAGAQADIVHLNSLRKGYDPLLEKDVCLDDYQILAIPGGFSYGDYVAAGKLLALDLLSIGSELEKFVNDGKLVIGICNGFQALVKSGFLPYSGEQCVTLGYNDSSRFECRHVKLYSPHNKCVWTQDIESTTLPVAHGEGKFIASEELCDMLFDDSQVVFQYCDLNKVPTMEYPDNPNGSMHAIAGVCDTTGRVFGLMPHPERLLRDENRALYTLKKVLEEHLEDDFAWKRYNKYFGEPLGLKIFKNAVNYFKGDEQ